LFSSEVKNGSRLLIQTNKNLAMMHVKKEHWMHASFFIDKVSSKVLTSGATGKYIKIKKKGFKNERPSEKASLKKRILSDWISPHNLGRQRG
jgi:hypothetical protein